MDLINFIEKHPLYLCFIVINAWLIIHVIKELVYKKDDDEKDSDDDSDDGITDDDDPVIDLPPGITLPDEPEEVILR
ncbi:MAG: hypothetical protein AAFQ94_02705 [Bacteroidota bacterium]